MDVVLAGKFASSEINIVCNKSWPLVTKNIRVDEKDVLSGCQYKVYSDFWKSLKAYFITVAS
jgi:hypothetical protein